MSPSYSAKISAFCGGTSREDLWENRKAELFLAKARRRKEDKNGKNLKVTSARQLRASVITKWLRQYNLREVQYRAGHRYISSTEAYKQNDMEGLKEEINKYHPLG